MTDQRVRGTAFQRAFISPTIRHSEPVHRVHSAGLISILILVLFDEEGRIARRADAAEPERHPLQGFVQGLRALFRSAETGWQQSPGLSNALAGRSESQHPELKRSGQGLPGETSPDRDRVPGESET